MRWMIGTGMLLALFCADLMAQSQNPKTRSELELELAVGHWREDQIVTPVNQVLTPYGKQVELPGLRPQVLALSPDRSFFVASGKTSELIVVDAVTGEIRQRVRFPGEEIREPAPEPVSDNILNPDTRGQVSYTGLVFSPDGKQIFLSNVNGSVKVFAVSETRQVRPSYTLALPSANAPRRRQEIPSGLVCSDDGKRLYVCGNLSNQLLEIDLQTREVKRSFSTGVAPYDVKIVQDYAFVSNWGGPRPDENDTVGPAGRGTVVKVDSEKFIANEGSVSVIDLREGNVVKELLTGMHASGLAVSPDKKYVVCANASSDNLSVIDVEGLELIETLWPKVSPSDLWGCAPNALAFDRDGDRLFVANGAQNSIAIMEFEPQEPGDSKVQGFLPVGWFPGAVVYDDLHDQVLVANIKGLPRESKSRSDGTQGFNTHHYHGTLSICPLPESEQKLFELSERVTRNLRFDAVLESRLPARDGIAPRPIPERIGEPSTIKHVVYIIKENRTYDQVLGDLDQGEGNSDLCIFGAEVTPNQHRIAQQFSLLDNTYCAGILSADGHQWSTTAASTDYMEKSFAGFPRSYPDGMADDDVDALAYAPSGFIWDNAIQNGVSIRNYGEFMIPRVRWKDPTRQGTPNYLACYRTWKGEEDSVIFASEPGIESIREFSPTGYVGWEMSVPDQYRADFVIDELKAYEAKGELPQLIIICLPNDHTSGTSANCPTPASCMADNDLAFGRIVEAFSHSKFWPEMAIFAIEDDPQAGWDHVSGYRTTAYVASPFVKRGAKVSTHYNTTSMLRTIEQILGLSPMNLFDASATPMFDCFTNDADMTPYEAVEISVPLDQMNPTPQAIQEPLLRNLAEISATLNFSEVDRCPEDTLNRILWHAQKGAHSPYPAWAITPGADDDDEEFSERQP